MGDDQSRRKRIIFQVQRLSRRDNRALGQAAHDVADRRHRIEQLLQWPPARLFRRLRQHRAKQADGLHWLPQVMRGHRHVQVVEPQRWTRTRLRSHRRCVSRLGFGRRLALGLPCPALIRVELRRRCRACATHAKLDPLLQIRVDALE